jgi:hypothetical protein
MLPGQLLACAPLTPADVVDFAQKPAFFYSEQGEESALHPRTMSKAFLGELVRHSGNAAAWLLAKDPGEWVMRCVAAFVRDCGAPRLLE